MTATPRFDALLAELCDLDETDAQLPQPVLINLHRTQLRAPLRGLSEYVRGMKVHTPAGITALQARLATAYGLDAQRLETKEVLDLYELVDDMHTWDPGAEDSDLNKRERHLVAAADTEWLSIDPLVWLAFLAQSGFPAAYVPALIEEELALQPETHRLALDMAALAGKQKSGARAKKTNTAAGV